MKESSNNKVTKPTSPLILPLPMLFLSNLTNLRPPLLWQIGTSHHLRSDYLIPNYIITNYRTLRQPAEPLRKDSQTQVEDIKS